MTGPETSMTGGSGRVGDAAPTATADIFRDLIERLEHAESTLLAMIDGLAGQRGEGAYSALRLHGKAEGVHLALSYIREMQS